jgi:hypothetical protein
MAIHLKKPYRIIPTREKRYNAHYNIPSDQSVVVPLKELGSEVLCDVRWENDNGELRVIHNIMFVSENLVPLNPMLDKKLFDIWEHYYNSLITKNEN